MVDLCIPIIYVFIYFHIISINISYFIMHIIILLFFVSDCLNSLPGSFNADSGTNKMTSYLTDIERPKGLYIYHGK